jgi:hypothetical protein
MFTPLDGGVFQLTLKAAAGKRVAVKWSHVMDQSLLTRQRWRVEFAAAIEFLSP